MAQLVDLLLQHGVVAPHQAADARNLQVVYGDRIGTNLLAGGALRETTLAQALGALHQVPYAAGADADSRPAFTRGLHRNVALAFRAVPARVDDGVASVFMIDPHDAAARAQLGQQLGRRVEPVVVCEARMWWLLHKFYLARKPTRIVVLDDEERQPRRRIRPRSETRPASIYSSEAVVDDPTAGHAVSSWPSFLGPAPVSSAAFAGAGGGLHQTPEETTEGFALDDATAPMELPPLTSTWPSFLGPEPVSAFHRAGEELLTELAPVEEEPVIEGVLVEPPRDTSPLSFDEAKKLLAGARDRDEIALIVLRSCLSLFARAVLLTVQGNTAVGWDGVGDGVTDVKDIRLPLKPPSIFQLARDSRAHFLGPLPKEKVNILFLKLMGAQIPKSALVVPVVVRGIVVNLLYCDNGKGKQVSTDIGDMLVVAQHINRSYEQLLKK